MSIEKLKFDKKNFNKHTAFGMSLLEKSLRQNGAGRSILVDKDDNIIAGNGIVEAAVNAGITKTKVVEVTGDELVVVKRTDLELDSKQGREMALADNATAAVDLAWDFDAIAEVETEFDIDASDWGVMLDDEEENAQSVEDDNFNADSETIETQCQRGEIWQLGSHRLMCGDSTNAEDVARLMGESRAELVFTDPPYGMKKEKEGVLNDNLNHADLLEFNKKWMPLSFSHLTDAGSWYCWGNDEPLMDIYSNILKPMIKNCEITFRNLITWNKGDAGAGGVSFMGKDGLRSYPVAAEKCLFVMKGVQGFNTNQDNYFEGWESVRKYLADEAQKVGLDNNKLKEICGVGMFSHWFTKSQWTFITEEHYKELQAYYNGDAFKKEYDALKKEYYATRAYFDNTHDNMTDVWEFNRTKGEERAECGDHATPKPLALCERAIKTSSRESESVLDLFGGSGSTLIACEQLNRKCYMMELDPHYCDVIIARWEKLTGLKAQKLSNG